MIYNSRNLYKVLNYRNNKKVNMIYNSRNLYKVLNIRMAVTNLAIYNSRNLYKVLNFDEIFTVLISTIVEIYIRY